jgi:DNA-directed RNA polymerase specialized sigma24 family protein
MPPLKRSIAVLRWVDGYNPTEIARLLALKPGTVRREIKEIRHSLLSLGRKVDFEPGYGETEEGDAGS